MRKKMIFTLLSLTLAVGGLCAQKTGWFVALGKTDAPVPRSTLSSLAEAAARHGVNQPRHWRALMTQARF